MTPYAVLLVRPSDSDILIRTAFHELSKQLHPDKTPGQPAPAEWYTVSHAYSTIKTVDARTKYERYVNTLSALCKNCSGFGVKGSRVGKAKIKVCDLCKGEGRIR